MNGHDAGYATIAITVFMSGLSAIALLTMQLSIREHQKSEKISDIIKADIELDRMFNETVASTLNNSRITLDKPLQESHKNTEAGTYVRVTSETEKVNVNSALAQDISSALEDAGFPRSSVLSIMNAYEAKQGRTIQNLNELTVNTLIDSACLHEVLTVFHSATRTENSSTKVSHGTALRIQVGTNKANRHADGTILITGKRSDPVWLMSWERYSGTGPSKCI